MPGFVEAEGPGVVGPLTPGWSAAFSAMPHSPLYESGTTGQISFGAPSAPDTAFLMFNKATFQYFAPDFWDELGVPSLLPVNDSTDPSDGGGPGNPGDGGGPTDPNDPNGWGNVPWGSSPWGGDTTPTPPVSTPPIGWGAGAWGDGPWGGGAPPPRPTTTAAFSGGGDLLLATAANDGGAQTATAQVSLAGAGGLAALGGTRSVTVQVPLVGAGNLGVNLRASATVRLTGASSLTAVSAPPPGGHLMTETNSILTTESGNPFTI